MPRVRFRLATLGLLIVIIAMAIALLMQLQREKALSSLIRPWYHPLSELRFDLDRSFPLSAHLLAVRMEKGNRPTTSLGDPRVGPRASPGSSEEVTAIESSRIRGLTMRRQTDTPDLMNPEQEPDQRESQTERQHR